MSEGEPRYQEIVLSIRFTEVVDELHTRQTILLFEDQRGRMALPSIRGPFNDTILERFEEKYGLSLENRGMVRFIDRNKEGLNVVVIDFVGVMGPFQNKGKYTPRFFPYDDVDEILVENSLTRITQYILKLFLTKLALRGRLC